MPTPKHNIPPDKLALYEKLIATNPTIPQRGAANPYTSLNGHMFTLLNPDGSLALRLPAGEREEFLAKYKSSLFESHGHVMKEFVAVPDSLLRNTRELQPYFDLSCIYVASLKPKPTTRKQAAKR